MPLPKASEASLGPRTLAAHMQWATPAVRCPIWAGGDQKEHGGHSISNQEPFSGVLVIPGNTRLPREMPPAPPPLAT